MSKRGLLIVLSGPSGVGKGTILKEFVNDPALKLAYSVSMNLKKHVIMANCWNLLNLSATTMAHH